MRRLFLWLARLIQRLLPPSEAQEPPCPDTLEIWMDGTIVIGRACGIAGVMVLCEIPVEGSFRRCRLISHEQAVDKSHFWRLWRKKGGQAHWDDGEPFRPEDDT